jgi:hypothetical protein
VARLWRWLLGLVRRPARVAPEHTLADEKQHGVDLMYRSGDTHHAP